MSKIHPASLIIINSKCYSFIEFIFLFRSFHKYKNTGCFINNKDYARLAWLNLVRQCRPTQTKNNDIKRIFHQKIWRYFVCSLLLRNEFQHLTRWRMNTFYLIQFLKGNDNVFYIWSPNWRRLGRYAISQHPYFKGTPDRPRIIAFGYCV